MKKVKNILKLIFFGRSEKKGRRKWFSNGANDI
jgi:hypothetical protein